jgi:MGT family glycosyltransferase
MKDSKTIVFFPEATFGPALNCVGVAQRLRELGHDPVFVADSSFKGVFAEYGFPERMVDMSEPMDEAAASQFWRDFIASHLPNFRLSAIEQIPNYVVSCWDTIVDTAVYVERELAQALDEIGPDLICVDNVILFPAIKRAGCPWIRIISCSENEIPDPDIPPHLSGCGENDKACFEAFQKAFLEAIKPVHERFNAFLATAGERPYPLGEFFETSPYMNLMLYPKQLQFKRRDPLDPNRFQYLEGCVREDKPYRMPTFEKNADKPLLYLSSGSMNTADADLIKRQIELIGRLPYRALVNVGDAMEEYDALPGNVQIASWFPQPSVIPQADVVIHHGGNNTFTESLYFGKPALIMPFCWDGHDNAQRVNDTGHGIGMHRYDWTDDQFAAALERLVSDKGMHARLAEVSAHMQKQNGVAKAADIILRIAAKG